ncbi:hypothetical protein TEK04_21065 [Klenkia sp. LSe6-5]|uniref:Uncharacterized protein n=1 Tax=Klenkia sesuvii TaxID=3103137 RepID=A0ABU8DZG3_9ACTN
MRLDSGRTLNQCLADLDAHRPPVLCWVLQPGAGKEGVGLGAFRMIKPWTEWMLM